MGADFFVIILGVRFIQSCLHPSHYSNFLRLNFYFLYYFVHYVNESPFLQQYFCPKYYMPKILQQIAEAHFFCIDFARVSRG